MSGVLVGLHATQDVADAKGFFTCRLTLVENGKSDKVMKVYPANGGEEKINLDIQPGQTRWKAVQRFLNRYVPRGEAVPEPIAYHSGKDLSNIVITEEMIPIATLEDGAVFEVQKEERPPQPKSASPIDAFEKRMVTMEQNQAQMLGALTALTEAIKAQTKTAETASMDGEAVFRPDTEKRRGRPPKAKED